MIRTAAFTLLLAGLAMATTGCGGSSGEPQDSNPGGSQPATANVRFFDALATSSSAAVPSVSTASDDGWFFLNEGGLLSFLRPDEPGGFEESFKRVQIGPPGVRPMELLADPGLDLADGFDDDDLIYVAGGRLGLWVMRVTDIPAPNSDDRAFRVDDSADGNPALQDSRRLCNGLELTEIGGEHYLLAMFAARDSNRLRVYALDQVRAVTGSMSETGSEIAPILDVAIDENPQAGTQVQDGQERLAVSLGIGMAVDPISTDEVDVYLAMSHAGLARVRLTASILGAQNPVPPTPVWGPAFGTGTAQHALDDTLRDIRYHDLAYDGQPVSPPVRVDPPPCLDVALQHDVHGHFIYVAAEHAGWLRFDVSDSSAWAADLPIDYHHCPDATPASSPEDNILCKVAPGDEANMFSTRLCYVGTPSGPMLVVANATLPIAFGQSIRTDGKLFDGTAGRFAGVAREPVLTDLKAQFCSTLLYDLEPLDATDRPEVLPALASWPYGHLDLHVKLDPNDSDVVLIDESACGPTQVQSRAGILSALRARYDLTTGVLETTAREPRFFRGRKAKMAGASIVHPDIILTATNDGGLQSDGILQICDGELQADYMCFPCESVDRDTRAAHGGIWGPDAQWVPDFELVQPFSEMIVGQGPEHGQQGHTLRIDYLRVGNPDRDPCLTVGSPDLIARWDFKQVNDGLGQQAQRFLWSELDPRYDEENLAGIEGLFVGLSAIGDGVAVVNRTVLERHLAHNLPPVTASGSDLISFSPLEGVGSIDDPGHIGHLLTHREYYQVHTADKELDRERFNIKSRLLPWNGLPQLFRLPSASGSANPTWILAAPSGCIAFPADHPVLQDDGELYDFADLPRGFLAQHPAWAPATRYSDNDGHLLVQFFDVTDPRAIAVDGNDIAIPLASKEIIGPDADGGAITIQALQIGDANALRTFLFVADFAGRVLVYDWDELDDAENDGNQSNVFARYEVLESVTDHFPGGNIYNMLVDRVLSDGDEPREFYYVYVPVTRVGVEVLRFDPAASPADRLTHVDLIETPVDPHWVQLRVDERGPGQPIKSMVVTDLLGGIHIFEYGDPRPAPE